LNRHEGALEFLKLGLDAKNKSKLFMHKCVQVPQDGANKCRSNCLSHSFFLFSFCGEFKLGVLISKKKQVGNGSKARNGGEERTGERVC
jgi:hypothetical protein